MPIYRTNDRFGDQNRRDSRGGFTLVEVALAMAIIAMLALLGLPYLKPNTGERAVRQRVVQVVVFLRHERNLAMRNAQPRQVRVDIRNGQITSITSGDGLTVPANIHLRLLDGALGVSFTPDGKSSGLRLLLSSGDVAFLVEVNGLTAAVQSSEAGS